MSGSRLGWPERFWAKVDKSGECWLWTGYLYKSGYGQAPYPVGKRGRANRVAWSIVNGPIPDGMWVLHRCDNRPCVRPDHLWLGTAQDNVDDMFQKGRWRPGRHHGGNGGWSARNAARFTGSGNSSAKLNEAQAAEIRRRRHAGERLGPLAAEFGVSETAISRIGLNKTWRVITVSLSEVEPRATLPPTDTRYEP